MSQINNNFNKQQLEICYASEYSIALFQKRVKLSINIYLNKATITVLQSLYTLFILFYII